MEGLRKLQFSAHVYNATRNSLSKSGCYNQDLTENVSQLMDVSYKQLENLV